MDGADAAVRPARPRRSRHRFVVEVNLGHPDTRQTVLRPVGLMFPRAFDTYRRQLRQRVITARIAAVAWPTASGWSARASSPDCHHRVAAVAGVLAPRRAVDEQRDR